MNEKLLKAISQNKLHLVRKMAVHEDWKAYYSLSKSEHGLLYVLFPRKDETKNHTPLFSQKCLEIFLESGYEPWFDNDIHDDFFTECDREFFKAFCDVIKKDDVRNALMIRNFLMVSLPWFSKHFEYMIEPKTGEIALGGVTVLERLWEKINEDIGFIIGEKIVEHDTIETLKAMEDGMDFSERSDVCRYIERVEKAAGAGWEKSKIGQHARSFKIKHQKAILSKELGQKDGESKCFKM